MSNLTWREENSDKVSVRQGSLAHIGIVVEFSVEIRDYAALSKMVEEDCPTAFQITAQDCSALTDNWYCDQNDRHLALLIWRPDWDETVRAQIDMVLFGMRRIAEKLSTTLHHRRSLTLAEKVLYDR